MHPLCAWPVVFVSKYSHQPTQALALIMGLATQSMSVCFIIFGANCLLLTAGLAVPWPTFNQHPVTWLPEIQTGSSNKKEQ